MLNLTPIMGPTRQERFSRDELESLLAELSAALLPDVLPRRRIAHTADGTVEVFQDGAGNVTVEVLARYTAHE